MGAVDLGEMRLPHLVSKLVTTSLGGVVFTVASLDLSGLELIGSRKSRGFRDGECAKSILRSRDYDLKHRVPEGEHRLVLMPSWCLTDAERTTAGALAKARAHGFVADPVAGLVPLAREVISDSKLAELGCECVVALHKPIIPGDMPPEEHTPSVLGFGRCDPECEGSLSAYWATSLERSWGIRTGFLFRLN